MDEKIRISQSVQSGEQFVRPGYARFVLLWLTQVNYSTEVAGLY